ncbi:MAG: 50S ribosomal protein L7/L12, partial [Streptococcus sp.]
KSKLNWKKLELQLLLNNKGTQLHCEIPV